MKLWTLCFVELLCAFLARAADAEIIAFIPSYGSQLEDSLQWHGRWGSSGGAASRHLQPWRSRGSTGTRSFSNGYYSGYSSSMGTTVSAPTYTTRTTPYSGTYSLGTTYTQRAMPTYISTGSGTTSSSASTSGTPYYSSGSSGVTYTGSSISRPTYTDYFGSSYGGSSTTYSGSSGTTYYGNSSPSFTSGTTYTGSTFSYNGTTTTPVAGVTGSSGVFGGRTFIGITPSSGRISAVGSAASGTSTTPTVIGARVTGGQAYIGGTGSSGTIYPASSSGTSGQTYFGGNVSSGTAFSSGASSTSEQTYMGGRSGTGTTFFGGVSSGTESPAGTLTYTASSTVTPTRSVQPRPSTIPAHTAESSSTSAGQESADAATGPLRDSNRGRGSSSFRSSGGGAQTSPVIQDAASGHTYYLREADGSLTPIEPPPYDQMKPDSYYTELYLADQPIRFENHTTKAQQFKAELEKAHANKLENESAQQTQGVMSLPLAEEQKGLV